MRMHEWCSMGREGLFYVNKPHMKALSNAQHTCALITMCLSMLSSRNIATSNVYENHMQAKYLSDLTRVFIPTMYYAQGFLGYPRNNE